MITQEQYLGKFASHPDVTPEVLANVDRLLAAAARLESYAVADGVTFPVNPRTGSGISGEQYGGFRPQECPIGKPRSGHKTGESVDLYDPDGKIDAWAMKNLDKLAECGIYMEHPSATPRWAHWTVRAPKSGNRVFYP